MTALGSRSLGGNISGGASSSFWPKSMDLTFDTTSARANVAGNVTNAIVKVALNAKTIPDNTQRANIFNPLENGQSLLFTDSDGTTLLPHESLVWNNGEQQGIIFVKVPQINGNSNTDKIIMKYGGNRVRPNYYAGPATNVWSDFWMVQHLEDTLVDATSNAFTPTANGNLTSVRGRVGKGRYIDVDVSPSDSLVYPASSSLKNMTQVYISACIRNIRINAANCFVFEELVGGLTRVNFGINGNPKFIRMGGRDADAGAYTYVNGATSVVGMPSAWHYVGGSWDSVANEIKVWLNGVVDGTNSVAIGAFTATSPDSGYPKTAPSTIPYFLDEIRVYNGMPTADWIKLDCETLRDNLIIYGRETPQIKLTKTQELFIDLGDIESQTSISLHVGSGTKHPSNPLLSVGTAAQGDADGAYGGHVYVMPDGRYRCYYHGVREATNAYYRLFYAESVDGVTWTKPNLKTTGDYLGTLRTADIVFNGDGGNNNLLHNPGTPGGGSPNFDGSENYAVLYDPTAPNTGTDTVWKVIYNPMDVDKSSGMYHYFSYLYSTDGINFVEYASNPVATALQANSSPGSLEAIGFNPIAFTHDLDDVDRPYKLYFQAQEGSGVVVYPNGGLRRTGIMYSTNCLSWTRDTLSPNIDATTMDVDGETQYHGMFVNRQGDSFYGLLQHLDITNNRSDIGLYTSRNGKGDGWTKINTGAQAAERLISRGTYGTDWDGGMVYATARHLLVGNDWRLYYSGDFYDNTSFVGPSKMGLITFRKNGYTYVQGGATGAYLLSYLYDYTAMSGRVLNLNIDPNGQSPKVELLNSSGAVITGYAKTDCDSLVDNVSQVVAWSGSSALPSQDFKVKIYLENGAKAYAYFFGGTSYFDVEMQTELTANMGFPIPYLWWSEE